MELTPTLLQEVEFRPEFRGYNRAEVDDFLDRVAASVEALLARLREAERGGGLGDDDSIRRTLVLAQRTADAAIKEAEEQAGRAVEEAKARADALVADAEAEARRTLDEAKGHIAEEVTALEQRRDSLLGDVASLEAHLSTRRSQIEGALGDLQRMLDGGGLVNEEAPELAVPVASNGNGNGIISIDEEAAPRANGTMAERPLRARPLVSPAVHDAAVAASRALQVDDAVPMTEPEPDVAPEPEPEPEAEVEIEAEAEVPPIQATDEPIEFGDGGPPTMDVDLVSLDEELERRSQEHDPFLAELRKAVTDDEPLGPREDEPEASPVPLYDQDYLSGREGFRSRMRRRT